jgi:uncharacterized protein (DUF2164 family)
MIVRTLIFLFLLYTNIVWGQDFLSKNIALKVKDLPIKAVLDQISEENGVYFTYAGNIEAMDKKVSLNIEKVALNKLLTDLFYGEEITFSNYANQIILKKKPEPVKTFRVKGIIISSGTEEAVEFASLQLKQSKKGTVGGIDGKFEIEFTSKDNSDSLSFYCIGYEPRTLSVKALTSLEFHKIYLVPHTVELPQVEKTARKADIEKEGNKGIPMGSLYLDTHGQQVALFIENKKNINGRLKTLNFYLSGKGNTEAPFRIRIYGMNDSLGCPGEELLPDILVVKPESGRGWFEVDISRYNIRFPEKGVFVAMEGIYPGDYKNYHTTKNTVGLESQESDDYFEGALEYGQRIGYNRFSKNQTWHYSVSHTWFQLGKKLFNVMISAEIVVYDKHKNKKTKL